jgi:hypothetical protein
MKCLSVTFVRRREARHRVALRRMGGGTNAYSVAPEIGAFVVVSFC